MIEPPSTMPDTMSSGAKPEVSKNAQVRNTSYPAEHSFEIALKKFFQDGHCEHRYLIKCILEFELKTNERIERGENKDQKDLGA